MAIAFAHVSVHTRAKGHSAIAASSYRTGTKLVDARTGTTYDFSKRHDVAYATVLLPEGCDPAFDNREFLWNQAELAEKRRDAQICKDVVLALPKELELVQQIELAKRFAQTHFVEHGLAADIAIHDHGDGNPHAHILIPTRRLGNNCFSAHKARDLNPAFAKGHVVEKDYWGERWRDMQNEFFAEKNIDLSVDLNHFISGRHHGKITGQDSHYLRDENKLIRQAREAFALDNLDNVINHLSLKNSVFTRRDVERLLFKTFTDSDKPDAYLQRVEQVLSHKYVVNLGENGRGQVCFTTRQQYLQEASLRRDIEKMMQRYDHVFAQGIDPLVKDYKLSDEQHAALNYIAHGPDISVVIGRPGTGKSYLLKPLKKYMESNQCQVVGAALSGKVAKSLQSETGIESSTIASLTYRLTHKKLSLSDKHVIVIDEAGMVDFSNMSFIIQEARKSGCKVVLVGDPEQLKPIYKGEIFKGISAITGYIELENIKRQCDPGDRQASLHLAKGDTAAALQHYIEKGAVCFASTPQYASDKLIEDWQQSITQHTLKESVLLAFTRAAVADLNNKAREVLKAKGMLGDEDIEWQGADKVLNISTGDRLLFRQNDKILGVRNGDLGTVSGVNGWELQVELDSGEMLAVPRAYQALDYGYALTVHKSQGMTTEHVSVLIDSKYWDRHLSFVAMTRHKQSLKVYADKVNHPNMGDLKRTLSRSVTKDNVIDWPLDFAIRAGFNPDKLIGKVVNHLAGMGHKIKEGFNYVVNYEILKGENLLFSQYDVILKRGKHLTGYYREKIDKTLGVDNALIGQIKQASHKVTRRTQGQVEQQLQQDLGYEHEI